MAAPLKFNLDINFCPRCGSVLPPLGMTGGLVCSVCRLVTGVDALHNFEAKYSIVFNSADDVSDKKTKKKTTETGPLADRKCGKCGHEGMTYASLQLRSADEGQTVFYTCPKCQFKETENS